MRRSKLSVSKILLILIALIWAGGHAQADVPVSTHYKRGLNLYKEGRYSQAILEFEAAYERSKLPRLLINMGQAHYELEQMEQALNCFERFLKAEPSAPAELRTRVVHRMSEVQKKLATRRESVLPPAKTANLELPSSSPAVFLSQPSLIPRPKAVHLVHRWWFWGTLSLASASVLGIALGVSLNQGGGDLRRPVFPPGSMQ